MSRRDYFKEIQQKRYHTSRRYRNPYLRYQDMRYRKIIPFVAIIVLAMLATTFFFVHPMFAISRVDISGVTYVDRSNLESVIRSYLQHRQFLLFHRSNRFLFSDDTLSGLLQETFALASIHVTLQEDGRTITIQLQERTSHLVWQTQSQAYIVDLEGLVVRALNQEDLVDLPLFIDLNDVPVEIGMTVLTPQEIENAFRFFELLDHANIDHLSVKMDRLAGKWSLLDTGTYRILLDLVGDVEQQFQNLMTVLQEQIEDPSTLQYIDLRFGDRVYYK